MELGLRGKIALITASSRGLGKGCAEQLAAEGCRVAICSRNENEAKTAATEMAKNTGSEVVGFGADMRKPEDISRLLEDAHKSLGAPDILVTNAGGPPPGTFATTAIEDYQKGLDLTLMSAVRLIHGLVPGMQAKRWGRIIAITSISVKQPIGTLLLSNMARAGLTGFLKTISTELAPDGITVNALLPGIHKTSRIEELATYRAEKENKSPEDVLRSMMTDNPTHTIGDPSDFGAAAAFLASDQAKYITGQSLLLDGGNYRGLF